MGTVCRVDIKKQKNAYYFQRNFYDIFLLKIYFFQIRAKFSRINGQK